MKKPADKQKEVTAATFRRLAKALRVRARNHRKSAKGMFNAGSQLLTETELARSDIYAAIASEFDHEATALRSMR